MLSHEKSEWFRVLPGQSDLLISRWADDSVSDSISFYIKILGSLEIELFTQAIFDAIARFECLRLEFRTENSTFEQRVVPFSYSDIRLELLDVGDVPESEAERYISQLFYADARSWNIWTEAGYVFRLVRRNTEHHYLLITVQHAIADGYSVMRIEEYIFSRYHLRLTRNDPIPTPAESFREAVEAILPPSYSGLGDKIYWRRMFEIQASTISAKDATSGESRPVTTFDNEMPIAKWKDRQARLAENGLTSAAWLLEKYSEFVSGASTSAATTVDCHFRTRSRRHVNVEGMFSVSRPVVMDWDENRSRHDVVREALFGAQLHQRADSIMLRAMETEVCGSGRANPDFNYVPFTQDGSVESAVVLPGNQLTRVWHRPRRSHARRARLAVHESPEALLISIQVDPVTYSPGEVECLLEALTT